MDYNSLLKEIQESGQNWSQWDLDTAKKNPAFGAGILTYKRDYANATDDAGRKAANAGAEALRRQYGSYLGGGDGSGYYGLGGPAGYQSSYQSTLDDALKKYGQGSAWDERVAGTIGKMENYGDFSYGPAPSYSNRYQQQLDELLGKVQNYGPFSWSKEQDPAYSAYAKQYRREGDRAAANAMAQAAAATGGQVSTAAMTAASQAGDYYAGQLSDKIPELYENAYQRYLGEYSKLTDQLGQTRTAEQSEYAKYLDQLGQYNTDRNLAYNIHNDGYNRLLSQAGLMQDQAAAEHGRLGDYIGAVQGADESRYGRYLDQVNFNLQQDALQRERDNEALALTRGQVDDLLAYGIMPSDALLAGSGYSGEYARGMVNGYQQELARAAEKSAGRSSGGGGSKSKSNGKEGGGMDYEGLFAAAKESGNPQSYIANMYKQFGFSSSSGLWNDYKNWAENYEDMDGGRSGGVTVDMKSVLGLGYGPIDDAELDRLVSSGQVDEYQEGNRIKFRRAGGKSAERSFTGKAW